MAARISSRHSHAALASTGFLVEAPPPSSGDPPTVSITIPPDRDATEGLVLVTATTRTLQLVGKHLRALCGTPASDSEAMVVDDDRNLSSVSLNNGSAVPTDNQALSNATSDPICHSIGQVSGSASAVPAISSVSGASSSASDTAGYLLFVEVLLSADPAAALVLNPRAPKCVTHELALPDGEAARDFAAVFNETIVELGVFGLAWPATLTPGPSTLSVRPAVKRAANASHGQPSWTRAKRWSAESWPVAVADAITKLAWSGADPSLDENVLRLMRRAMNFTLSANRFGDWVLCLTPPPGRWREFMACLPGCDLVVDAIAPPLQWVVSVARTCLPAATPALAIRVMEAARRHFDPLGTVVWAPLALHSDHWVSVGEASTAFVPESGGRVVVSAGSAAIPAICERCLRGDPLPNQSASGAIPVHRTIPTGPAARVTMTSIARVATPVAPPVPARLPQASGTPLAPNVHSHAAFPALVDPQAVDLSCVAVADTASRKRTTRSDTAEAGIVDLTASQPRLAPALRAGVSVSAGGASATPVTSSRNQLSAAIDRMLSISPLIPRNIAHQSRLAASAAVTSALAACHAASQSPGAAISGDLSPNPSVFYAVAVGWHPGVYAEWDTAKLQTLGGPANHKSFATLDEATAYIRNFPAMVPRARANNARVAAHQDNAFAAFMVAKDKNQYWSPPLARVSTAAATAGRSSSLSNAAALVSMNKTYYSGGQPGGRTGGQIGGHGGGGRGIVRSADAGTCAMAEDINHADGDDGTRNCAREAGALTPISASQTRNSSSLRADAAPKNAPEAAAITTNVVIAANRPSLHSAVEVSAHSDTNSAAVLASL